VIGATQEANGTLTASFTVDGQSPVTFNPFDGSHNVNTTQWTVSQTLFHQEVAPGAHQLTVTLDAVTGAQVRMTSLSKSASWDSINLLGLLEGVVD
jgi:hypothetical protein